MEKTRIYSIRRRIDERFSLVVRFEQIREQNRYFRNSIAIK